MMLRRSPSYSRWDVILMASSMSDIPSWRRLMPSMTASFLTDGIFIAGTCQGPKDIPDTVAQGGAAASQVAKLISQGTVMMEPVRASVREDECSGCRVCNTMCPYGAIEFNVEKNVSHVITALCQGCGTCVAACPSGVIDGAHFTNTQVLAELNGILWDVQPDVLTKQEVA